jgi:hypothetical protein
MKKLIINHKKKFGFLLLFFLLVSIAHGQTQTLRKSIYFDVAKYNLSSDSKSTLDQVLDSLKLYQNYSIAVYGNTDYDGDSVYNIKLSEKRVLETQQYLTKRGIKIDHFSTFAYGEEKPIADNATEPGKQKNRRVDIVITYTRTVPEENKQKIPAIAAFYSQIGQKAQEFFINPSKDTLLRCEQGTIVYIKANTLKSNAKGTKNCVTIKIKEFQLKSDMILDNLSTTSNGEMIESAGMVNIEAYDGNGKKINRIKSKGIVILIPSDKINPNMQIFKGKRSDQNQVMNWTVDKNVDFDSFRLIDLSNCDYWVWNRYRYCPFFSCKVKNFFRGIVGNKNKSDIIFKRRHKEQRIECRNLKMLYQRYGIKDYDQFNLFMNKALMDSFNVKTMSELLDTLEKRKIQDLELAYMNKTIKYQDLQYYIFNRSDLGYANCDAFVNLKFDQLTTMRINLEVSDAINCKLIFKNRRIILPADRESSHFKFKKIPRGEDVWIVAIKYVNGQPYLFMEETTVGSKDIDVEFKPLTIEELKLKLKELD